MIRFGPRQRSRLRSVEAVFWMIVALAAGVGGVQALQGAPVLAAMLVPPGLLSARASDRPAHAQISLQPVAVAAAADPRMPADGTAGLAPRLDPLAAGKPAIAIVIDDLGSDPAATEQAIALPPAITLAFLPYPEETPVLARKAARAGHEIIVHVPMEPMGLENPGPNALLPHLPRAEIVRRLDWALARVPENDGINNHEGSRFTADRVALIPVMEDLAKRHEFFLDSRTTVDSAVVPEARAFGVPSAQRDVFLDDTETAEAIGAQLAQVEDRARQNGVAIAIGHPHAVTLAVLKSWRHDGFVLVPAREAIRLKTEHDAASLSLAGR